jgi:hypothetical protein
MTTIKNFEELEIWKIYNYLNASHPHPINPHFAHVRSCPRMV